MAEDRPIVLYPTYFDSRRTRRDGRRVPKALAVDGPSIEEIEKAAKVLGLKPTVDPRGAFPKTPWQRDGRVLVRADYFKTSVIRKVAEKIRAARKG